MKQKLLILLFITFTMQVAHGAKLEDLFDRKEVQKKVRETIADQDINFKVGLGDIELTPGVRLSDSYNYNVEASYLDKHYTRIDKWDVQGGVNVGEIIKNAVDIVPFSFSMNRNSSIIFVRQFPKKIDALRAIPYTPYKLPVNANAALKNLKPGDFVSMPANLNVAFGASASTSWVSPFVINANAQAAFVLSGEFIIQVYKIDETHVRLKLITKRGRDSSGSYGMGTNFNFFGIKILDHQIDRLLEKDLAQYGISYNPGAQFIIDYVFDLSDKMGQMAYDRILSSTFKFKDLIVADMINPQDLKDKLISSYDLADEIFFQDRELDPNIRRVNRIFKGFNSYRGHTRHLKLGFFITNYTKDRTFTEAKINFIDKNEKNLEFYYPTYSRYIETNLGKRFFNLKDQSYQNNFGLIPRFNEGMDFNKNPELGFTFERKDRYFTAYEQRTIIKFLEGQIPSSILKDIDFSDWSNELTKMDSRIFFQLVLKAQGFGYLKGIPAAELRKKLGDYVSEKKKLHDVITAEIPEGKSEEDLTKIERLKDFLFINRFIEREQLDKLASNLTHILNAPEYGAEERLKKIVELNEFGVFDKIGVGFLISLMPKEKLSELIYMKLNLIAKDVSSVEKEVGTLNYGPLYRELTQVQSRLSNRGYDLRLSDEDREISDRDVEQISFGFKD